jgi:hypothetical protein
MFKQASAALIALLGLNYSANAVRSTKIASAGTGADSANGTSLHSA